MSKLTNDLVSHDPMWPVVLSKLPFDIPKFEGNGGEDPGEHVTTFHLWCSSNSLNHDFIHLRLLECILTGPVVRCYIEFPVGTHRMLNDVSLTFLNHFQLPVHYDSGTKLLSTFKKTKPHIFLSTFRSGIDKRGS